MTTAPNKIQVFNLGIGYRTGQDGQPFYGWPYTVDYAPTHPKDVFYVGEGDTRNGNGNFMPAAILLEPMWREHIETAGATWLLPIIERVAVGDKVSVEEVLGAYKYVHGVEAKSEQWILY